MKNRLLIGILILLCPFAVKAKRDSEDTADTGRSHLFIRPLFQAATPERLTGFRYEQIHAAEDGCNGAFQAVVFGSRTTNDEDLAAYFSPCGIQPLRVNENINRELTGPFELLSSNFGVISPQTDNLFFSSIVRFAPTHREIGVGLQYRQSFWPNEDKERGWFFSISMPIMQVRNDMNLCERILEQANAPVETFTSDTRGTLPADEVFPTFGSMTAAFNQRSWKFGKITRNEDDMTKTGVADIELTVGYEWLQHEPYHLETYIGVLIPTGTKVKSEFLFEPIVGHGHHVGLMFGSNIGLHIWDHACRDWHIRYEISNHSLYLLTEEQVRSIDLKGRPWSRYLPVYVNREQAEEAALLGGQAGTFLATPGINVFTRPVDVRPGLSHTINSAFLFEFNTWRLELGYNFYARSAENVELCSFPEGVAVKALQGLGQTAPLMDIGGLFEFFAPGCVVPLSDFELSIITPENLDLASASTPAFLTNTLYANLGYHCDDRENPLFGNVGVSFEFSESSKAVAERWVVWGKFGIAF